MIALDASALLAFMFRETGYEHVAAVIADSCISTVNVAEVIGRFVRDGHDSQEILERLQATAIEVVPFTQADAAAAANLLPKTQPLGLSLGDRACLALALARGIPALTADQTWTRVDLGIAIEVIR
jgi:PIN domain nuclease of toxin-antitoxin system